ncbi:MFS transporter [Anaerocolumna xylanovorans]|uniref:Predicted arabinose efflux permease, MFS family n=1 Tax=Anaerocolumna xylanovorans DSM 12503 TaxID=1121345 RepID=A0A1M7XZE1_9FIRM|nr:MFS transporter [Anaerocolumna xylanovorans]SHO44555.1 Predicted arabinose efflux permease, MFS family [Anaerocolumna xylanovorans DSM 12503]
MTVHTQKKQALLPVVVILFWFAQYVYIPYQTPYLLSLQVSETFIGSILGAYGITQLLLRLPIGVMADSVGRHKGFILYGTLAAGIASLIRLLFPNGYEFLIANLLSGMASSMWISFMVMYTGFFPEEEQQKATGRIILSCNLGILLGFLFSSLLYKYFGMDLLCILSMMAGALGTLLAFFLKEEKGKGTFSYASLRSLKVCLNKKLILFSLLALIQQGVQMSTAMSFTTQILKERGASAFIIGLSSIIYMASAVLTSGFSSSQRAVKTGPKVLIPFVFLTLGIYCILVPLTPFIPVLLALQFLPGMATGILFSNLTSEAMKGIPAKMKSTAMGFYQAVYALGITLFPMFTGNLIAGYSHLTAYTILALTSLIGAAVSFGYYCFQKNTSKSFFS